MQDPSPDRSAEVLTEPDHWNEIWTDQKIPRLTPRRSLTRLQILELFDRHLVPIVQRGGRVLEAGCAGSAFLTNLAERTGREVYGVDYSENGCEQLRRHAAHHELSMKISCADLLQDDLQIEGEPFDAVFSMGLVEHFAPPSKMLGALASLCRPGGIVFTSVPNFAGVYGPLQRHLASRENYEMHEILPQDVLCQEHRDAGLRILESGHYGFADVGVLSSPNRWNQLFWGLGSIAVQLPLTQIARLSGWRPNSPSLSPFVYVVAERPADAS